MPLRLALLLIPLCLAPAESQDWRAVIREQARWHGWEKFHPEFTKEAVAALGALSSTKEHYAFVLKHGIDLQIREPGDKVTAGALGSYADEDRTMYINKEFLLQGVRELRVKGAAEDEIPNILAWKALHVIVHEIRHGMTNQGLREEAGLNFRAKPIENEYISFFDQLRAVHEILRVRPELWQDDSRILEMERDLGVLLQALNRDIKSLKEFVAAQPGYHGKDVILKTKRSALLREYRGLRRELRASWADFTASTPDEIVDAEIEKDLEHTAMMTARSLRFYNEVIAVLEDESAFRRIRSYYGKELRKAEKLLRRARQRN